MSAVRRVWCPQDARDTVIAARAVEAKGFAPGGVVEAKGFAPGGVVPPGRPRVLCEYVIPASQLVALGVGRDWLARLNSDPMPVSTVPGRTRGRHRATRFSLRVEDVERSL